MQRFGQMFPNVPLAAEDKPKRATGIQKKPLDLAELLEAL
jgi:hypothetical protein